MRMLVAAGLAMGLLVRPAWAEITECANQPTPREGIAVCTRLLRSGQLDARTRSFAHSNRGVYYANSRQPGLAMRDANAALTLDPRNAHAYLVRASAHEQMGQRAAAIRDFKRALTFGDATTTTREAAAQNLRRLGVEPDTARAEPETQTGPQPFIVFRIRNRSGASVGVAFYAQGRRWCWPNCNRHHPIHDAEVHTYRVNCQLNEQVCWGAWKLNDNDFHWGVGFENGERCERCCYSCIGQTIPIQNLNP